MLPARDPVSPGERPAANRSPGTASLPSFLVFLSFPLNNKQDQFGKKFKKEKLRPKHSLLCRFLLHLLLLLLRDVLQRKRVTGLDTALGEGESRQTPRDIRPETEGKGRQPAPRGWREGRTEGGTQIHWVGGARQRSLRTLRDVARGCSTSKGPGPLTSPQAELGSVGSVGVFRPL